MDMTAHHIRSNPSIYFQSIDFAHTEHLTDIMGMELAKFFGASHVRNQDGNSYWFGEAYHDNSDALAPFILNINPDGAWKVDCHAGDVEFISNCLQNDVWRSMMDSAGIFQVDLTRPIMVA